jgi:hypothetical protein
MDGHTSRRRLMRLGGSALLAGVLDRSGIVGTASAQAPELQAAFIRSNGLRFIHCALAPMTWYPPAEAAAQNWANISPSSPDSNPSGVIFAHEQQVMYGENIPAVSCPSMSDATTQFCGTGRGYSTDSSPNR